MLLCRLKRKIRWYSAGGCTFVCFTLSSKLSACVAEILSQALSSGVVPLIFFVAFWITAFRKTFRATAENLDDATFRLPMLIFALCVSSLTDFA
jgi:hypothetical protein